MYVNVRCYEKVNQKTQAIETTRFDVKCESIVGVQKPPRSNFIWGDANDCGCRKTYNKRHVKQCRAEAEFDPSLVHQC